MANDGMIELKKGPVHRIVATQEEAKALVSQGYIEVDENGDPIKPAASQADQIKELTTANNALMVQVTDQKKTIADLQKQVADLTAAQKPADATTTTPKMGGSK